ncbi:glycine betaine transporter [Alkalispirochaeta americana]|uniref:Glycine betaine transporter n=1 Tax=Alkalispirochaeta americana TaxID=159291 RepID=A0A1N6WC03_9SPIO|nr:BCCT family transporter [Alkalispirochaeta americana]SIQ87679.1 glycine betaine transporter [Alkalispirochaeta americana]
MRNGVFVTSLVLVLLFVAVGIFLPAEMDLFSAAVHGWIIEHVGWAYLLSAFVFLVFSMVLAVSPFGSIRLGADTEKPQYSYFGWFSMLFAAGMGIGLIFWGVAEPMSHYLNPPEHIAGSSPEAAAFAMRYSFFHWGMHPWAIYIVMSLSIAYFSFRRGMPPLISSCFYPLLGDRIHGFWGQAIDTMAVIATVFGIVTSLGLGAMQIADGVGTILPLPSGVGTTLVIIAVVTVLYMISSMTGLDKGIQLLSRTNVFVAVALLLFVLVVGPSSYILNIFTTTLGEYFSGLVEMSLSTNPFEGYGWTRSWTLFYWAWWISWSPFVGLFVASISRGRTIREFVLGATLVPALLTFLWFSVFGGTAFAVARYEDPGFATRAVEEVSSALFILFEYLPFSPVLTILAVVLLTVFFVTSADSATFVLAMMTSRGSLDPPAGKKLLWGAVQSTAAAVLLLSGGLEALQRMAIVAALPFTGVMLLMVVSLYRGMHYEVHRERRRGG